MALGHWGARWIGSRLKRGQLDAGFLMWDIRRFVALDELPRGRRVVIHFRFTDARAGERRWWLVVENGSADLCRDDPGRELTLVVESTVLALTEIWTGDREPDERDRQPRAARQRRGARCARPVALARPQRVRGRRGRRAAGGAAHTCMFMMSV